MKSIQSELSERIQEALVLVGLAGDPLVVPSQDRKFGDYQSNCAMGLGKKAGRKPRELAEEIHAAARLPGLDKGCHPLRVGGLHSDASFPPRVGEAFVRGRDLGALHLGRAGGQD